MARRIGVERILRAGVREFSRQQRLAVQRQRADERAALAEQRRVERHRAETQRQLALSAKERDRLAKAQYLSDREEQCDERNQELELILSDLSEILPATLGVNDAIDFETLRSRGTHAEQPLPQNLRVPEPQPDVRRHISGLKAPGWLGKRLPWVRRAFEDKLDEAKQFARDELMGWQERETARKAKLSDAELERDQARTQFVGAQNARNAEVDVFEEDCRLADPDALVAYFSMVLERSEYPADFPQNFSVALQQASRLLVIRYELPGPAIVPEAESYRYVKARDVIEAKPRKASDRKSIYADVIAGVVLRTIHEVLEADVWEHLEAVAVNGMVKAVDPATGRDIEPCLLSVRTTRGVFSQIDLARVDKAICLRNLGAQVSRSPEEIQAVKPIVEFKMTDPRFVDQSDLVSELSTAANLMELNPFEFEELVANLFGKMGLESKLTRSSRDGGVDCVAFDPRPVLGGKVVIQAKRYKHTVGVSAVRDLYGTMLNEGASKGLLVTTSGYGPDAFNFARDKPIELIDGGGLLYLLTEIGVDARIVMPNE